MKGHVSGQTVLALPVGVERVHEAEKAIIQRYTFNFTKAAASCVSIISENRIFIYLFKIRIASNIHESSTISYDINISKEMRE